MCDSHLTLLYFFVSYVDNMMEWDAVATHLNWYSFTTVYASVLWTSASDGCFLKNSEKRVLLRWNSLLHFGPLHEDEKNCSRGTLFSLLTIKRA